jgi:predicted Zn-dependent peptidase
MQDSRFGWAHLMEHVVANNKSTIAGPPRPEGIYYIEGNALTRPYYTSFVSVLPPGGLLAPTIHSRMARAGRADSDSTVFATQVGRVLAELERDESGQYPAYKALVALATNRSPRIADELELIRKTGQHDLAAAIVPIYRPDNALFVIAGDIDLDSTRALVHEAERQLGLTEVRSAGPLPRMKPTLRTGLSALVKDQNHTTHNIIGVAWPKPSLGDPDQLPLLIADQLMLGRGEAIDDPVRSEQAPMSIQLAKSLGGFAFWDGRSGKWGAPDIVDTGPSVMAIVFNTDSVLTIERVRTSVTDALRNVRRDAMSGADIERARESLASFYERWFFEPTYRILADHLVAYAATGRDPEEVKMIPSQIRRVRSSAVRAAFDRYLLKVQPDVVILPH